MMNYLSRLFFLGCCLLVASAHAAGESSLLNAVKNEDVAEVKALLAKGADVNANDTDGKTPLHRAAAAGRRDLGELLLAKGADVNAKSRFGGDTPAFRDA